VKHVLRETEGQTLPAAYATLRSGTLTHYTKMLTSEDAQEGPRAFGEKRAPRWSGR
jgi:crotonobetainyl-CoA hydratase